MVHSLGYGHAGVHNGDLRSGDFFDERPEERVSDYSPIPRSSALALDERQDFFFDHSTCTWGCRVTALHKLDEVRAWSGDDGYSCYRDHRRGGGIFPASEGGFCCENADSAGLGVAAAGLMPGSMPTKGTG